MKGWVSASLMCLILQKNSSSSQGTHSNEDDDDCPHGVPKSGKVSVFETAIKLINTPKPKTDQIAPVAGWNLPTCFSL